MPGPHRMSNIHAKSSGRQIIGSMNTIEGDKNMIRGNKNTVTGSSNQVKGNGSILTGNDNYAFGDGTTITGERNTSLGASSVFTGSRGIITGKESVVTGNDNNVSGDDCKVTGDNCKVSGDNCKVSGNNCTVIGDGARITGDGAVVLGEDPVVLGKNCTVNNTAYPDGYSEQMAAEANDRRDAAINEAVRRAGEQDLLAERRELARVLAETEHYGSEGATNPNLTWYCGDFPVLYYRLPIVPGPQTNLTVNIDGVKVPSSYNHDTDTGFCTMRMQEKYWRRILRDGGRVPVEYTDGWSPSTSTGRSPTRADRKRAATERMARERLFAGAGAGAGTGSKGPVTTSIQMASAVSLEKDDKDADEDDDAKMCQLCCEKEKCASASPCGHIVGCGGCSVKLCKASKNDRVLCPVCREPVVAFCRVRL